jgi:hypothetical protein
MLDEQGPQLPVYPRIEELLVPSDRAHRMHAHVRPQLPGELLGGVRDGPSKIRGAKQIRLAQDDHRRNRGLLQAMNRPEIIVRQRRRGVDQHEGEIAPRQIREGFRRAGSRQ